MKRIFAMTLLACFVLLPLAVKAQTYTSISEMNEQPPGRWTQAYETKWRTVEIDVQPIVPQVENMPVLKVTPDLEVPDISPLGEGWTSDWEADFALFHAYLNGGGFDEVRHAEKKLGGVITSTHYFPPYDMGRVYAENSFFTLGDVIGRLKSTLTAIGEDPENWWYKRPIDVMCNKTVNKKTGKYLLPGDYTISLEQQLSGIPLFHESVDHTVKRSMKQEVGFTTVFQFDMRMPDEIYFGWAKVRATEVLSEDVPLCAFSSVQATLEREINAGHIRKIFDIDLGYALYHEPGIVRGADHPKGVNYYALPVWRVNCYYIESAKKGMRDYTGWDVPERGVIEYRTFLINAQTGKFIDSEKKGRRRLQRVYFLG